MHIVQAQHKSGLPVQGSQRNASICRQYLPSIILNPESVEESSEHTQTAAQPSLFKHVLVVENVGVHLSCMQNQS